MDTVIQHQPEQINKVRLTIIFQGKPIGSTLVDATMDDLTSYPHECVYRYTQSV